MIWTKQFLCNGNETPIINKSPTCPQHQQTNHQSKWLWFLNCITIDSNWLFNECHPRKFRSGFYLHGMKLISLFQQTIETNICCFFLLFCCSNLLQNYEINFVTNKSSRSCISPAPTTSLTSCYGVELECRRQRVGPAGSWPPHCTMGIWLANPDLRCLFTILTSWGITWAWAGHY